MSKSLLNLSIVVALDKKNGIGKGGGMPWHLPEDLKFFKEITTGRGNNAVIMGSNTWFSIPPNFRPLRERKNIILSKRKIFDAGGSDEVVRFESIALCLESLHRVSIYEEVFVIGGEKVYQQFLPLAPQIKSLYITEIEEDFECTKFFPREEFLEFFDQEKVLKKSETGNVAFAFKKYTKKI